MKQFMITFVVMLAISIATIGKTASKQVTPVKDTISNNTTIAADSADESNYGPSDEEIAQLDKISEHFSGVSEMEHKLGGAVVPIVAIIAIFGMPVFIILIALYFQNKNKQAKYKLAEKALENGKDIPEGLFDSKQEFMNGQSKGIKNIFLGVGLGIFLWALTGEFGLGCVGFMVMFMGIGQVIIHRTQGPSNYNQPNRPNFTDSNDIPKDSDDK